MSHIDASRKLAEDMAGDMFANVAAGSIGRVLAVQLFNAIKHPGMKKMLSFMIARDTMHQQHWFAVVEEPVLGPAREGSGAQNQQIGKV